MTITECKSTATITLVNCSVNGPHVKGRCRGIRINRNGINVAPNKRVRATGAGRIVCCWQNAFKLRYWSTKVLKINSVNLNIEVN